jgi:hypothetical protein
LVAYEFFKAFWLRFVKGCLADESCFWQMGVFLIWGIKKRFCRLFLMLTVGGIWFAEEKAEARGLLTSSGWRPEEPLSSVVSFSHLDPCLCFS